MPPTYWSTGIQASAAALSIGWAALGSVKRAKYQELSTKGSSASVSWSAGSPHAGQVTCREVGWRKKGLPGLSKVTSSANPTGNWSSGTACGPQVGQWIAGIG